ncbi:MAG: UDP-N-acetylglucosamine 2-epimerase (non-hydrolyzing) [Pseudomonadota bacterium]
MLSKCAQIAGCHLYFGFVLKKYHNLDNSHYVAIIFGTRPEIIKLSPIYNALADCSAVDVQCIFTGQQKDLAPEFLSEFAIPISRELAVMRAGQSLGKLMSNLISALDDEFSTRRPRKVIVQGDTNTALAGAIVANLHQISVLHVEAGLRTFDPLSPFPEETNRKLISQLASHHFAATDDNKQNLLKEGIAPENISVTGNPIVDIVKATIRNLDHSPKLKLLLEQIDTRKLIVLTAHRRENFDFRMAQYFKVINNFLNDHPEFSMVAPVHPNPSASQIITNSFADNDRVHLIEPLGYRDFISLLVRANLIVSDSGGIQEEAATINRQLIVLRETTERPEAIDCGIAKLAPTSDSLRQLLSEVVANEKSTILPIRQPNPFGDGESGRIIAEKISRLLASP